MVITFYPTVSSGELGKHCQIETALLPVSSWAGTALRNQGRRGLPTDQVISAIPVPKIPDCMTDIAVDCGGFVATLKWGSYRYTPDQYVEWCDAINPKWAAMMDYCCENEITSGHAGIVRERQNKTTEMASYFWNTYKSKPWCWVPTIQGWTVEDYQWHVRQMKPLITEMHQYYSSIIWSVSKKIVHPCDLSTSTTNTPSAFRVGIGTLCARASSAMIRDVVSAVTRELPGIPIHLWGVKLGVMKSSISLADQVVSVDSAAWNGMFATGRNIWKQSGYTQREWCFKVALPAYEAKIKAALSQPKQMSLI